MKVLSIICFFIIFGFIALLMTIYIREDDSEQLMKITKYVYLIILTISSVNWIYESLITNNWFGSDNGSFFILCLDLAFFIIIMMMFELLHNNSAKTQSSGYLKIFASHTLLHFVFATIGISILNVFFYVGFLERYIF